MSDLRRHRLFLEGVRLFNAADFYECHDALEELWSETLGDEREFLQGLIHAAVALFHFESGNLGGARKMYGSARRYLTPYAPRTLGLDVQRLLEQLHDCFRELNAAREYPAGITLDRSRLPRIDLSDAPR